MNWRWIRQAVIRAIKRVMQDLRVGETYWGNRYVITRIGQEEFKVRDAFLGITIHARKRGRRWHIEIED